MKSQDIRAAFLDYFRSRGHEVVRSSPLIPRNDPTLLFTNAGMVQFKSVFLGEETRQYARAATCQKSMRAGGKHSDLENVGHTSRHHTFFEMLGNFSFGDYFKREAIGFAWELLTQGFSLPSDRLWVTVYEDDDEAERLWQETVGVPRERIVRMGAKDNFWQMADTGPCGPCSEIHIDQGEGAGCGRPECAVGCDCDRFLELWNLVFMQFDRGPQGVLTPLPRPSIDTGMGLERITAVLQGKRTNFDTDLFAPIIGAISAQAGVAYGKAPASDVSIRVIADHIRSAAFLIGDGLMPANDGRGYVLRRIIRRASRHARLLGVEGVLLARVLDSVVETMGGVYPELIEERERARKVLEAEEERFTRTLRQGLRLIDDLLDSLRKAGGTVIPGDEVFKLYDTYGFPLDLARDIALDGGFTIDEAGFQDAMRMQRERARASWVGEEEAVSSIYRELLTEAGSTEFVGYETLDAEVTIRAVLRGGAVVAEAAPGEEVEVFLDRTPFYGASGGQVGDTGSLFSEHVRLEVLDTTRPVEGLVAHRVRVEKGPVRVWDKLHARVDAERRADIRRNHTTTHLLQAALRTVLGEHVKQAGSLVEPDRFRFDFTHFSSLGEDDAAAIEEMVNEKVLDNIAVATDVMDVEEAVRSGAMALFGEKYGDRVRVVRIGEVSRELCGGTHCGATGEIGTFRIASEGSVASGIRRIEGLTGRAALRRANEERRELREMAAMLKTSERPSQRIAQMLEEIRSLQKDQEKSRVAAFADRSGAIAAGAREAGGVRVVVHREDGLGPKEIRDLADKVRDRLTSGVVVLASAHEGQATVLAMVTRDLTKRVQAGAIVKAVCEAAGGRGGGKPEMAQGGTKEIAQLDAALATVYDMVGNAV